MKNSKLDKNFRETKDFILRGELSRNLYSFWDKDFANWEDWNWIDGKLSLESLMAENFDSVKVLVSTKTSRTQQVCEKVCFDPTGK